MWTGEPWNDIWLRFVSTFFKQSRNHTFGQSIFHTRKYFTYLKIVIRIITGNETRTKNDEPFVHRESL